MRNESKFYEQVKSPNKFSNLLIIQIVMSYLSDKLVKVALIHSEFPEL